MTVRTPLRNRRDDGFTLLEVVVTVVMIGLISAVLAAAITVIFRSEGSAIRVTAESHDTQQGVNFFTLDVQAGPTELAAYDTNPASPGCVAAGTNVLDFIKGNKRISYRLAVTGSTGNLDRYICENTGTVAVPVWSNPERVNIADSLDASTPPAASVALQTAADGTLQSAQLTLAQVGPDALVVASPRAEPLNSPGDCASNNPIEAAHGFGTFTESNVLLKTGAVTGWLAVGGTLSWESNITVASDNMSGVDPAFSLYANDIDWLGDGALPAEVLRVGRNLDIALGTPFVETGPGGDFVRETAASLDNFIDLYGSGNPNARAISSLPAAQVIDFGDDFDELRDCSAQLARALEICAASGCAEEVAINTSGTNINLCPSTPKAHILNLQETYLGNAPTYSFTSSPPPGGCTGFSQVRPIIVNVIDTNGDGIVNVETSDVEWAAVAGDTKNIIFNFPDSFVVNLNVDFFGQVLAPFAHVHTYADVEGGVIAREWTHHAGTIDSAVDLFNGGISWP